MNSIQVKPERVEIEHSLEKEYYRTYYLFLSVDVYLNAFTFTLMILNIIKEQTLESSLFRFFVAMLIVINFLFIMTIHELNWGKKPIYRVKIAISGEDIVIYVQNRTFKQFLWQNFERIIVTKESFSLIDRGFRVNFQGSYWDKHIRLYVLNLSKEKVNLVLASLEEFSKRLNKEYIVKPQREKANWEEVEKEIQEVRNFRKAFKEKKKLKKYTAYERRFRPLLDI